MGILDGFLDNLFTGALTPKGNMADFQHAARLYADNVFRLAPKTSYLYHVVFRMSDEAQATMANLNNTHKIEINMLVKEVDLPQYSVSVETKNQYNRKKNVQTRVDYQPVNIVLHDDNLGLTTTLMEQYYKYYVVDGRTTSPRWEFDPRNAYGTEDTASGRYGLDHGRYSPFFDSIDIYQMSRRQYVGYRLVNPIIERFGHDSLAQSDTSKMMQNEMTVKYEAVIYSRDGVFEDNPTGFAVAHYDKTPSPLSIEGGGTGSLLGTGGVLSGIDSVLGDFASGNVGLGTLLKGANTIKNAKNLSWRGVLSEGTNLIRGAIQNAGRTDVGGVPNTTFPGGGDISSTTARPSEF